MSKMTKTIAALSVVAGLGVAALPLSSYAADVDVYATVDPALSVSTTNAVVRIDNVVPGGAIATGSTTVNVSGSVANGYKLQIQGKGGTALTEWNEALDAPAQNPATITTGDLNGAVSAWGYRVGSGTAWAQIPTTASDVAGASSASTPGPDSYDITFGVKAASGQKPGTYKGGVTITAVANS